MAKPKTAAPKAAEPLPQIIASDLIQAFSNGAETREYLERASTGSLDTDEAMIDSLRSLLSGRGDDAVAVPDLVELRLLRFLAGVVPGKTLLDMESPGGIGALALASGIKSARRVLSYRSDEGMTEYAQRLWAQSGHKAKIATPLIPKDEFGLPRMTFRQWAHAEGRRGMVSLVYLGGHPLGHESDLDTIYPLVRRDGVIVVAGLGYRGLPFDGFNADVVDADRLTEITLDDGAQVGLFAERLATDERFEATFLPIGDGVTLLRKVWT